MHQRRGVEHLHHGAQPDGARPASAEQFGREQHQGGPQPLAAARLKVLRDGRDRFDRGDEFHADRLFDLAQIVLDEVEHTARGYRGLSFANHLVFFSLTSARRPSLDARRIHGLRGTSHKPSEILRRRRGDLVQRCTS